MARDFARIRLSIADDPEFEALSVDAQHLYLRILIPEPTLNYAGVADWRPNRLTPKARDLTLPRLLVAAAEVEERKYVLFDLDTEEALVRTYIRSDELLRNPKMALSIVKAYQATASRVLRAIIVNELHKAREEHPEYTSWSNKDSAPALARLLTMTRLDPADYTNRIRVPNTNADAVVITNTDPVPNTNADAVRNGNPNTGIDYQSEYQSNSVDSLPATATHNIQHATSGGFVSTEGHQASGSISEPPPRCPRHIDKPTTDPCIPCRSFRIEHEAWTANERRRAAAARSDEILRAGELRAQAVAACDLCDEDGYRGTTLCDHDAGTLARAARGMAGVRAAMATKAPKVAGHE